MVDKRVREAEERGEFANLPRQGKPLPKDDEDAGSDWLAHHLMHEAGVLPDWLQLRKEIYRDKPEVRAALDDYHRQSHALDDRQPGERAILARLEERYVKLATQINKKIDEHNLRCPSFAHELARFPEDAIERARKQRTGSY